MGDDWGAGRPGESILSARESDDQDQQDGKRPQAEGSIAPKKQRKDTVEEPGVDQPDQEEQSDRHQGDDEQVAKVQQEEFHLSPHLSAADQVVIVTEIAIHLA